MRIKAVITKIGEVRDYHTGNLLKKIKKTKKNQETKVSILKGNFGIVIHDGGKQEVIDEMEVYEVN